MFRRGEVIELERGIEGELREAWIGNRSEGNLALPYVPFRCFEANCLHQTLDVCQIQKMEVKLKM